MAGIPCSIYGTSRVTYQPSDGGRTVPFTPSSIAKEAWAWTLTRLRRRTTAPFWSFDQATTLGFSFTCYLSAAICKSQEFRRLFGLCLLLLFQKTDASQNTGKPEESDLLSCQYAAHLSGCERVGVQCHCRFRLRLQHLEPVHDIAGIQVSEPSEDVVLRLDTPNHVHKEDYVNANEDRHAIERDDHYDDYKHCMNSLKFRSFKADPLPSPPSPSILRPRR